MTEDMPTVDGARAEAERRWSSAHMLSSAGAFDSGRVAGFVAGVEWLASTVAALEAEVERMEAEAEPEVVETAEELDALPVGSVVRTAGVGAFLPRVARKTMRSDVDHDWWIVADEDDFEVQSDELDDLPARVLYRPDATDGREGA